MSYITDRMNLGYFPLQDHAAAQDGTPIGAHLSLGGVRIDRFDSPGPGENPEKWLPLVGTENSMGTFGDVHPWMFWQTRERGARGSGIWTQIVGAVARDVDPYYNRMSLQPVRDGFWTSDKRLAPIGPFWPEGFPYVPRGTVLQVMPGTEESRQEALAYHADPRLVAPHTRGTGEMGTLVVDLDPTGELCMDGSARPGIGGRHARLQTIFRVIATSATRGLGDLGAPGNVIALNFSTTQQEGIPGYGAFFAPVQGGAAQTGPITPGGSTASSANLGEIGNTERRPTSGDTEVGPGTYGAHVSSSNEAGEEKAVKDFGSFTKRTRANHGIGLMGAVAAYGPIHAGSSGDKHQHGMDRDGHPVNAGHISTGAYFFRDATYDAPLEFGGDYPYPPPWPLTAMVHLSYDAMTTHPFAGGTQRQGLWRWWAEVPYLAPDEVPPVQIPPVTGGPTAGGPRPGGPAPPNPGGPGPGRPGPGGPVTGGPPSPPRTGGPRRPGSPPPPQPGPVTPNPIGPGGRPPRGPITPGGKGPRGSGPTGVPPTTGGPRPRGPVTGRPTSGLCSEPIGGKPPDPNAPPTGGRTGPAPGAPKPTGPTTGGPSSPSEPQGPTSPADPGTTPWPVPPTTTEPGIPPLPIPPSVREALHSEIMPIGGSLAPMGPGGMGTQSLDARLDLGRLSGANPWTNRPQEVPGVVERVGQSSSDDVAVYTIFHPMAEGFAGLNFRPQLSIAGLPNFLRNPQVPAQFIKADELVRPQVLSAVAFGGVSASQGDFDYVEAPENSRARGGTANGGLVLTPPRFELEDYYGIGPALDVDDTTSDDATSSHFLAAPGVAFSLGKPNPDGTLQSNAVEIRQASTTVAPLVITHNSAEVLKAYDDGTDVVVELAQGGTAAIVLPTGTTGERPTTTAAGMLRFNTTTSEVEMHTGSGWSGLGAGGGGATWGSITGTLSAQTDLQNALDAKVAATAGAFTTAAPTSAVAASSSNDLMRKAETDAGLATKAGVGAIGSSGLTMNNGRLLGRTTSGSGAIGEITAGTNMSLSGGALNCTLSLPVLIKAVGSSTSSVAGASVNLTWSTPEIGSGESEVSISGSDVTINTGGTYKVTCTARVDTSDQTELTVQMQKDTGGGYTDVTNDVATAIVGLDATQDVGSATLSTATAVADGDKLRFVATGAADGDATLLTAGTILLIEGPL